MEKSDFRVMGNTSYQRQLNSANSISFWLDEFMRRAFDIIVSLLSLIFLAPVFLLIGIAIKRDTSGPVFYRGPRVGKGGKNFGILKFRTMYERPESYEGARITAADDDRITPLGKWLRETKINELPQLWNVLIGDMSLVGPRPEDPTILNHWPDDLRNELLSARPGVTSPASVLFRDEQNMLHAENVMDDYLYKIMPSKMRLDLLYIRNRNFFTDLDVIFWTIIALLPRLQSVTISEHRLYWGPFSLLTSRYISWFILDSLISFLSIGIAGLIWRSEGPLHIGWAPAISMGFGMALFFSIVNAFMGLNSVVWSRAPAGNIILLGFSIAVSTSLLILINRYMLSKMLLPSGILLVSGLLIFGGATLARYRDHFLTGFTERWVSTRGRNHVSAVGERVLLIGAGHNCQMAIWFFGQSELSKAFNIVGIVDDDPRKQGLWIDGFKVLGMTNDIPALVNKLDVGMVLFAISNISEQDRQRIFHLCQESQVAIVILPDVINTIRTNFRVVDSSEVLNGDLKIPIDKKFSTDSNTRPRKNHLQIYLAELDSLAQAGKWNELKERLTELRENVN